MRDDELSWREESVLSTQNESIFSLETVYSRSYSGKVGRFIKISPPDWVTVIPVLDDDRFLMVKQFRHGSRRITQEFPAGAVDPGEEPEEAARRELSEETGYGGSEWVKIGSLNPNPAFMTNRVHTFLAKGLFRVGEQRLDENEIINVFSLSRSEMEELIGEGEMDSAIMIQAWFWFLRHLKEV